MQAKHFQKNRVVHKDPNDKDSVLVAQPWTWKATQQPPFIKQRDQRAKNKRARASRKANR